MAALDPGQAARRLPGIEGVWVFVAADLTVFGLFFVSFVRDRGRDAALEHYAVLFKATWRLDPDWSTLEIMMLDVSTAQIFVRMVITSDAVGQPVPFTQFIQQPTIMKRGITKVLGIPDGQTALFYAGRGTRWRYRGERRQQRRRRRGERRLEDPATRPAGHAAPGFTRSIAAGARAVAPSRFSTPTVEARSEAGTTSKAAAA